MRRFLKNPVKGFLHTRGRKIVNDAEDEVILCGWGAGNWMNPEGFMVTGVGGMFGFTSMEDKLIYNIRFDRARTMNDGIRELCGSDYANAFWPRWYRNYLGEADIKAMAQSGYNSIRLPLESSAFLYEEPEIRFNEDSFLMLSDVLDWCEKYGIYAILDMHAAPGGQSGVSCDNGLDNVPRLFMEPESWQRAILLWEEFARRYKDRYIVGGYELLNEPIATPQWHGFRPTLRSFYEETIEHIRKIDQRHMIILQSPAFAHDLEFYDKPFDTRYNNWCYSVHMHGIDPDIRAFYPYMEPSLRLNVPVWVGECSGKNEALAVIFESMAALNVGFNLFSWKSMEDRGGGDNGILQYKMPDGWDEIIKYIAEGGPRPSYARSVQIFDQLLEMCKYENCLVRNEKTLYCQRRQGITLPAVGYDLLTEQKRMNNKHWPFGNVFNYRTEDQMKMIVKPGGKVPGLFDDMRNKPSPMDQLWLELSEGDCVSYTIYKVLPGCRVNIRAKAETPAVVKLSCETKSVEIAVNTMEKIQDAGLILPAGDSCCIQVTAEKGTVWLDSIIFACS